MTPDVPVLTQIEQRALLRSRYAQAKHRAQHDIKRPREVWESLGRAIDRCRIERGLEPLY